MNFQSKDKRNSFVLYLDSLDVLDDLNDKEVAELFRGIKDYVCGKTPKLNKVTKVAFSNFKNYLDRDHERWKVVRQKRSKAGKNGGLISSGGGRPKNKQKQAKQASASFAKQKQANQAVTVTVPVNVNGNVSGNVSTSKTKETKKKTPSGVVHGRLDINECIDHFKESIGVELEGSSKSNRQYCYNLIGRMKKSYPKRDPVEAIELIIDAGLKDGFHAKNLTGFKYLFYNYQKIINSHSMKKGGVVVVA